MSLQGTLTTYGRHTVEFVGTFEFAFGVGSNEGNQVIWRVRTYGKGVNRTKQTTQVADFVLRERAISVLDKVARIAARYPNGVKTNHNRPTTIRMQGLKGSATYHGVWVDFEMLAGEPWLVVNTEKGNISILVKGLNHARILHEGAKLMRVWQDRPEWATPEDPEAELNIG